LTETVDTYLLLRAFADELARCGVAGACTSPGSRSTPLVLSLVREERLPCWSHVDERCGAFFGLGVAKATGRPVALACTSGTAAANYLPAVVEAYEARVPLVVLTADRPPELRGVGAGQAIDQVKLYGDAVKWFFEVGSHAATPERLRWVRQLACRAVWTAAGGRPGPVHLNFPLREPLVLDEELPADDSGHDDGRPWIARIEPPADAAAAAATLEPIVRGATRAATPRSGPRCRRSPPPRAGRCSPTRCRARGAARTPSPTTTRCCASTRSHPPPRPTSSCVSATCRRASRCARGCARPARCRC
jgi:2-succinyl-5-enolpyruvyl-6-hydroxy-3-cyclohexene-1-carboxylate synthase